jgi:hypothetical protein
MFMKTKKKKQNSDKKKRKMWYLLRGNCKNQSIGVILPLYCSPLGQIVSRLASDNVLKVSFRKIVG